MYPQQLWYKFAWVIDGIHCIRNKGAQCTGQSEWMVMCLSRSPHFAASSFYHHTQLQRSAERHTPSLMAAWWTLMLLATHSLSLLPCERNTLFCIHATVLLIHFCISSKTPFTLKYNCNGKKMLCYFEVQLQYKENVVLLWRTTAIQGKCCVTLKYNCNTKKMLCYFEVQLQYKENVVLLWSTTAIQGKCCVTLKYNCNTRKMLCYFEVQLQYKENVVFLWSTTAMGRKCCVSLNIIIIIIGLLWLTINFKMNFADMIYSWDKLMHRRTPSKF